MLKRKAVRGNRIVSISLRHIISVPPSNEKSTAVGSTWVPHIRKTLSQCILTWILKRRLRKHGGLCESDWNWSELIENWRRVRIVCELSVSPEWMSTGPSHLLTSGVWNITHCRTLRRPDVCSSSSFKTWHLQQYTADGQICWKKYGRVFSFPFYYHCVSSDCNCMDLWTKFDIAAIQRETLFTENRYEQIWYVLHPRLKSQTVVSSKVLYIHDLQKFRREGG